MDIELNVFDFNFNRIGEISKYNELTIERHYTKVSTLTLRIAPSKEILNLLQHNNIITTKDDVNYGYIIQHFYYSDTEGTEIEIYAYSLNYMLSWRTFEKQQRYYGNVEDVVKAFINSNCINPTNPNRIIPNLRLASNSGIYITTESTATGKSVEEHCFELCNSHEICVDVLMNHDDKKYDVYTWQGLDRSTLQNANPRVIFSKEFDNIINQKYTNSKTDYKNVAVVAGEGEGIDRTVVVVNDELSGFNRREIYVDARDLQSTYTDDNGNEITLTPEEYKAQLKERGNEKLPEYKIIETFESEVNNSQFIYGTDYELGDKVSVRNDEINRILHTRVISATLTSNREGINMQINFGSNIPTLYQKIKKKVS